MQVFSVEMFAMMMRRGFTLVELLVVIAIISVLAAMLLPTLAASLNAARLVVCAKNVSQIGIAVTGYANDNRDRLPGPVTRHAITHSAAYYSALDTMSRKGLGDAIYAGYIPDIGILYCPGAAAARPWNSAATPGGSGPSCFSAEYARKLNPFVPAPGTFVARWCAYSYWPWNPTVGMPKTLGSQPNKPFLTDYMLGHDWHDGSWNRLYPDGHVDVRTSTLAVSKCLQQFSTYAGAPGNWADTYGIYNEICVKGTSN